MCSATHEKIYVIEHLIYMHSYHTARNDLQISYLQFRASLCMQNNANCMYKPALQVHT